MRISQRDILEFCVADRYEEHPWPDETHLAGRMRKRLPPPIR